MDIDNVQLKNDFKSALIERHSKVVQDKLETAIVGIAGVGGLGSNIAIALARMGIRKIVIVDFDKVELSNINRQAYFIKHIGMKKIDALQELIYEINPIIKVEKVDAFIDKSNAVKIFEDVDIIVEALDNPKSKAEFTEKILLDTNKFLVGASGMAGYLSGNTIQTKRKIRNYYLAGDEISDMDDYNGLMSPRVLITAGHQANMVLRLILGELIP